MDKPNSLQYLARDWESYCDSIEADNQRLRGEVQTLKDRVEELTEAIEDLKEHRPR
jgi:predicted nuclease with TOPRIM domain